MRQFVDCTAISKKLFDVTRWAFRGAFFTILLVLLAATFPRLVYAAAPALDPENTYAVIVGVLEWRDNALSSFSKENRRDQGLYDVLKQMGVPEKNMALLLGKDATESRMREALDKIAKQAQKGATFIFYYAGHGWPGSQGIYFANYDIGAEGDAKEGFLIDHITNSIKENFAGGQVLLFADCCYSGGLEEVAADLASVGIPAASLTSASIANTSTSNWTFSCSIIDAFAGQVLLDTDQDGYISIAEAANHVGDGMNYIERQHHGYSTSELSDSFRLSAVRAGSKKTDTIPAPYSINQYVRISNASRRPKVARIVGYKDNLFELEIQQYHDRRIIWSGGDTISQYPRPNLEKVADKRPIALSPEAALAKATVDGKYNTLLKTVPAKQDYRSYSAFSDYGKSSETNYAGIDNLPVGYWVYVYPNWYIFENKT